MPPMAPPVPARAVRPLAPGAVPWLEAMPISLGEAWDEVETSGGARPAVPTAPAIALHDKLSAWGSSDSASPPTHAFGRRAARARQRLPPLVPPRGSGGPVPMRRAARRSGPRRGEGVAVERAVALDADLQDAVGPGAGDAEQHVARLRLAPVERGRAGLRDAARDEARRAGDAAAVAARHGERDPLGLGGVEDRLVLADPEHAPAPVGEGDGVAPQSQMSEVTSPPG